LLLVAGLGFVGGVLTSFSTGKKEAISPSLPVTNEYEVVALGRLEPEGGIVSVGGLPGDRVDSINVEEGKEYPKGEELALLDSRHDRQAEMNLTQIMLKDETARSDALLARSKAVVRQAELRIEQVTRESALDIEVQKAKIRVLEAGLDTARNEQARLRNRQFVSPTQKEQQDLAVLQALEELAAALAVLEKLKTGQNLGVKAAEQQLESAKADLNLIEKGSLVDTLTGARALAKSRLQRTRILAPCPGKILKIISHPGEQVSTQPILQMANTSKMLVVAEVYETERQYLKTKQKATITSPALPRELSGEVEFIGQVVANNRTLDLNPTADADRRVIEVKVKLVEEDTEIAAGYLNMQVTVKIEVKPRPR